MPRGNPNEPPSASEKTKGVEAKLLQARRAQPTFGFGSRQSLNALGFYDISVNSSL